MIGDTSDGCLWVAGLVLRSIITDHAIPAGVYFGTNSGSVFASGDEGDTWMEVARHLPTRAVG